MSPCPDPDRDPSMPVHRPAFEDFARWAGQAACVPVFRQLTGDGITPTSAYRRIERGAPSFLFESVVGGEKVGRYSFLGTEPFLRFEARGREIRVTRPGDSADVPWTACDDPFRAMEALLDQYKAVPMPGLPRFTGGAVGFASYDSARYSEHLPDAPPDDRGLPDLSFAFFDRMVLFDHVRKTVLVVAHAHIVAGEDPRAAYDRAAGRVDELVARLGEPGPELPLDDIDGAGPISLIPESNFSREQYEAVVRHCQEYIRAGDIFQVVPSQRFKVETEAEAFDIYRVLRVVNPSPFLFYLNQGDYHLVGCSPEILVRVEDGTVTVRPIAGTRRRGVDEADDRRLAEELLADPKERAEHIMLVDLGRNDIGRVAVPSTVRLGDLMTVERYSHVMHITSNVTGTLAEGKTAFDALRAGLPAGTVSGAPKIRAMEIIDQVEPSAPGAVCRGRRLH